MSAEPLQWLEDGSPFSPRFGDRYHSHEAGGLAQARGSFLHGCGLPQAWAGQAQWRILETGFGLGLNFLATWQAWRDDAQRCARLHFISTEAWPVAAADLLAAAQQRYPQLLPLAQQLAAQFVDMHSGVHRLSFEGGRVHLTLAIGDALQSLRREVWRADSVYLDGFGPAHNPEMWSAGMMRALARCCIRGHTRLASWCVARSVQDALRASGFEVERVPGTPPKKHNLRALYAPHWDAPERPRSQSLPALPALAPLPASLREKPGRHCIVVGAGLAGASVARAMAERGWRVSVLEEENEVAQGASGLPVGLFAPHISPDDAPLSRLSRAGVRCTLHTAREMLGEEGKHWQHSGVLEHRVEKRSGLPGADAALPPGHIPSGASRAATPHERGSAGVDGGDESREAKSVYPAVMHTQAGWLRPAALVRALLDHPHIAVHTGCAVLRVLPLAPASGAADADRDADADAEAAAPLRWQIHLSGLRGQTNARPLWEADCVFLAAAYGSLLVAQFSSLRELDAQAQQKLPLNPVRGQVAWGLTQLSTQQLPAWPVNGKGSLVHIPAPDAGQGARLWISGGTFERGTPYRAPSAAERAQALEHNRARLQRLMPARGQALAAALFDAAEAPQTWSALRCTVRDRLPMYGPWLADPAHAGLMVAAGLGSRGLTLACLCAQILAAQLHDEPLPVERALAALIDARRFAAG